MQLSRCQQEQGMALPLYSSTVSAGFPSPADDFIERALDLNEFLIKRPAATFFAKVDGNAMAGEGIHPGDYLVVDRSLTARHGAIVLVPLNGELTVRRLYRHAGRVELHAANPKYPPARLMPGEELQVWGVVTSIIRKLG